MTSSTPLAQIAPVSAIELPPSKSKSLSRRQKAAIIVRFLLNEGAEVSLTGLSDEMQADLTQMLAQMRYVDRDTLAEVLMEFASELESVGLSFPRDIADALSALEGRISPMTATRLRKEAGVRQIGDPWGRIRALPVLSLVEIVMRESTEVAAVMLAKLDVPKAAELLGQLPGDKARRITYAISMTGGITPDTVDRIGLSLATALDDKPPKAFDDDPSKRIGDILNVSAAATRDDVLVGLEETDAGFADQVRKAIFTFADIPARLPALSVPALLREAGQDTVVKAFASGEPDNSETVEFLLGNISVRMADQIREDIQDQGKVTAKDREAAMTSVVLAIRQLQDRGEVQLLLPEDES
ncbi:FliG C-terminal domain-containing protein [Shimia thalassica]|uniref:flagellar motor switch protein FliG n=1 Tax=Shimia thalassica TaxID=1715693 RepID=UPI001C0889E7|nr:FliG C-terminal domain-containing protein [Shimia thalassica]MBU2941811.1 flagellar motor switch protein FliG [Shimia thalassica]MDO6503809.1 FliG C-terminal domain-containing protein [Shimia thalassica]